MKKLKRNLSIMLILALIFSVFSYTGKIADAANPRLSAKSVTMKVGDTKTIKLLNSKKPAKWSIEDERIKIVSQSNKQVKIKAVECGTTKVYALVGKKEYKCKVIIKEKVVPQNTYMPDATDKPVDNTKEDNYISDFEIPKKEIYNGNNISISINGTEKTNEYVKFEFICLNNSEIEYSIYPRQYAINDLMAGGNNYYPYDVPKGKKVKFSIEIEKNWLKDNDIREIKKLDIYFTLYNDYKTNWDTETITIKTNHDNGEYYKPKGEQILFGKDVFVYLLSNSENSYTFCLKSNLPENDYWSVENCSINDWVYDLGSCKYDLFGEPIISGKYSVFTLVVDKDFMKKNEINSIKNVEFEIDFGNDIKSGKIRLDIKNGIVYSSTITKPTSIPAETEKPVITPAPVATAQPTVAPTQAPISQDKLLYKDENVSIMYTGISGKENYYDINFIIENTSNKTLEIQVRETSINGFMVDPICSIEVAPGKKAVDGMTISYSDAELIPMSKAETIETKFHIFSWDGEIGYDTENIAIIGKSSNPIQSVEIPENKPQEENLSQKTYITKDKFVVEYTNNGNSIAYFQPSATFFNASGRKVAVMLPDDKSLIIAPKQTAYSLYEISSNEYASAETSVKFDTLDGLVSYTNCLDIETIDKESRVDCIVKNISDVEVNAHIVAVFKDGAGNIVYATSVDNEEDSMSEFGLQSGESSITFFSKPYDISYASYSISYYAYDC